MYDQCADHDKAKTNGCDRGEHRGNAYKTRHDDTHRAQHLKDTEYPDRYDRTVRFDVTAVNVVLPTTADFPIARHQKESG